LVTFFGQITSVTHPSRRTESIKLYEALDLLEETQKQYSLKWLDINKLFGVVFNNTLRVACQKSTFVIR